MRLEKQKAETIVKLQEVEATIRSLEQVLDSTGWEQSLDIKEARLDV